MSKKSRPPDTSVEEKREFTRVPIQLNVDVRADGSRIQGRSADLSLKGLYFVGGEELPDGAPCRITLHLSGSSNEKIEIEGTVARSDGDGCGIEVTGIHGLRSLEHFKQLLLHNSGQASRLEEEFEAHVGIKRR